jgi:FkbM family methyltransferase
MSVADQATFLQRLKATDWELDVFFDVGASIGGWSVEAQAVYPDARFEMFEPLAGRYEPLDRIARHSLVRNGRLHPVALSDVGGTDKIKVLGNVGEGSSILLLDSDYRKNTTFLECEVARMDDIIAERNLPKPDFIKLDTQAAELKVLKGALEALKTNKFLLAETWMRRVYGPETPLFHELASFLYGQNYVLFEMLSLQEGRDPDGTLRWFDAVFINKAFARFPSAGL